MGLPRIDTKYFRIVHADDPDVTAPKDASGWLDVAQAGEARPGATVLRVRALTAPEMHAVPRGEGAEAFTPWLHALALAAMHDEDAEVFAALPWMYAAGVGKVVLDASSPRPDPITAPSSGG